MVIVIDPREFRRWLGRARQALLDRVCELADAPQEELLAGIGAELRRQVDRHRVRPAGRSRRPRPQEPSRSAR